jgi:hypothetical protein
LGWSRRLNVNGGTDWFADGSSDWENNVPMQRSGRRMQIMIDQLPPVIAEQVHPDRRKHELEYWTVRDQIVESDRGMWIEFDSGEVIAVGTSPVAVFHNAESSGRHPFFVCVGYESRPCRIRGAAFSCDSMAGDWRETFHPTQLVQKPPDLLNTT